MDPMMHLAARLMIEQNMKRWSQIDDSEWDPYAVEQRPSRWARWRARRHRPHPVATPGGDAPAGQPESAERDLLDLECAPAC